MGETCRRVGVRSSEFGVRRVADPLFGADVRDADSGVTRTLTEPLTPLTPLTPPTRRPADPPTPLTPLTPLTPPTRFPRRADTAVETTITATGTKKGVLRIWVIYCFEIN